MSLPLRDEVELSNTWDLSPIYSDNNAWTASFAEVDERIKRFTQFKGKITNSAQDLERCIVEYLEISRALEKVYTYAWLMSTTDFTNSELVGRSDQATGLYARFKTASSFLTPELVNLDSATLESYLKQPALAPYVRFIRDIVRFKPHTLSQSEEELMARASEVLSTPGQIFTALNDADFTFGKMLVDGNEVELTHGSFILLLRHQSQTIRRQAFEQFYKVFDGHRHTLAAVLCASIKKNVFVARSRRFSSCRQSALFPDDVPETVYDNLVETVNRNLPALHKYYELRKKVLALEPQYNYDTHVPLVPNITLKHSYEEAADLVVKSLTPLGEEYCKILKAGLGSERWVDRYENKGKRSGAFSSGCYDSAPYILMNYKEEHINDIFTLTHEAGHSMHSYYSRKCQQYQDHDYTIFVAEVASTLNEQLLLDHMIKKYSSQPEIVAYLINYQLDQIKSTLYRQTMFAEFERDTHALAEADQPLTVDSFRQIYSGLIDRYFGASVKMAEHSYLECFRIPYFYSAFYAYKYSTGISAAIALSQQILAGDKPALTRYLAFLKSGGTKYPIEQLKDAGVDMNSPAPIETALKLFGRKVNELERLLAK